MIKLYHTDKSNYDIDSLDKDDIVVDTFENVIVINKVKHPFMSITDTIDDTSISDSSVAMSQKGVKKYIIETEETYTNSANALKEENTLINASIGIIENRLKVIEAKLGI